MTYNRKYDGWIKENQKLIDFYRGDLYNLMMRLTTPLPKGLPLEKLSLLCCIAEVTNSEFRYLVCHQVSNTAIGFRLSKKPIWTTSIFSNMDSIVVETFNLTVPLTNEIISESLEEIKKDLDPKWVQIVYV